MLTLMGEKFAGVALGLTVVMFALAGCAGAAAPTPTPTVEASTFLDGMRATDAFFGFPDAQLHRIGKSVCDALRDGSTFDDLVETLAITDYDEDQVSTIIFASSREYCPEQEG
jgi:hypothetical protein